MSGVGTSTKVTGKVVYPPFSTVIHHWMMHFRGAAYATVLALFVAHSTTFGAPGFALWVKNNTLITDFLATNPGAQWLDATFFGPGTAAAAEGKNMLDAVIFVMLGIIVHETLYYGLCGFLFCCDVNGWLQEYKLPRTPRMRRSPKLLWHTHKESFVDHWITQPVALFFLYVYIAHFPSLFATLEQGPPTFLVTMGHMAMASLCNELLFYVAHRAFHEVPGLYVRFHKQHHKYVGSIGWAAEYAHPLEQILANKIPSVIYGLVMSRYIDQAVWFTWLAWRLWETYEAHSGYSFKDSLLGRHGFMYGQRAEFHDWHHSDNRGCYGVYWIDYLCGTMDSYAQLQADGGHKGRAATRKAE